VAEAEGRGGQREHSMSLTSLQCPWILYADLEIYSAKRCHKWICWASSPRRGTIIWR